MTEIEITFGALYTVGNRFWNKLGFAKNYNVLLEEVILFCVRRARLKTWIKIQYTKQNKKLILRRARRIMWIDILRIQIKIRITNTKTNILCQESQAYNVD